MEKRSRKAKIFISYSHADKIYLDRLKKHLDGNKDAYEYWHDENNNAGSEFWSEINNNIINSDIFIALISADYLGSNSCNFELNKAYDLYNKNKIIIISCILNHCDWTSREQLSGLLAIPKDGKPVATYNNQEEAWSDVINSIKPVINDINYLKSNKINEEFEKFLNSSDILELSHGSVEKLEFKDIYTPPALDHYVVEKGKQNRISTEDIENKIDKLLNILLVGKGLSGKTSFCKFLYGIYRENEYIPVYIDLSKTEKNRLEDLLRESFNKSYTANYDDLKGKSTFKLENLIIPIVDNFHLYKKQESSKIQILKDLEKFKRKIITIGDTEFFLMKSYEFISSYDRFQLVEFDPKYRNKLIKKWRSLKRQLIDEDPFKYEDIYSEKVENTLGLVLGKGLMPSYPFYILSSLFAHESHQPINLESTSHGHCYQTLIYLSLRKSGIQSHEIDTYINYLTVLSYKIFSLDTNLFYADELEDFFNKEYSAKYNINLTLEKITEKLSESNIITYNSEGIYEFKFPYIYYYFLSKYLSENINDNEIVNIIDKIITNLYIEENAYILSFISHHSKSEIILNKIIESTNNLFSSHQVSSLNKVEMIKFDQNLDAIIDKAILPNSDSHNPVSHREKSLVKNNDSAILLDQYSESENEEEILFIRNYRLSLKTGEVLGQILKNRYGSLPKEDLKKLFKSGLLLHLRILNSFVQAMQQDILVNHLVELIQHRLENVAPQNLISKSEKNDIARKLYWNYCYNYIYGILHKTIYSLGTDGLRKIIKEICIDENTPAAFIIYKGIDMWYGKRLGVDELSERINRDDFSGFAENMFKYIIANHAKSHNLESVTIQKLNSKLKIPIANLKS